MHLGGLVEFQSNHQSRATNLKNDPNQRGYVGICQQLQQSLTSMTSGCCSCKRCKLLRLANIQGFSLGEPLPGRKNIPKEDIEWTFFQDFSFNVFQIPLATRINDQQNAALTAAWALTAARHERWLFPESQVPSWFLAWINESKQTQQISKSAA